MQYQIYKTIDKFNGMCYNVNSNSSEHYIIVKNMEENYETYADPDAGYPASTLSRCL